MSFPTRAGAPALAALCLALSACGGGGTDDSISITAQPQAAAPADDGSTTYTVQATSALPLSYQWTINGQPAAGGSAASVTVPSPSLDTGDEQVAVTISNGRTSVTSDVVTLHWTPALGVNVLAGAPGGPGYQDGTGTQARFAAWDYNDYASYLTTDANGNLVLTDANNVLVRRITPAGVVTTAAGQAGDSRLVDGPAATARLAAPSGVTADAAGNVYVGDLGVLRRIAPDGTVSSVAGTPILGNAPLVDGVGTAAYLGFIYAMTHDAAGNLYIADGWLRKVTPAGVVTTLTKTLYVSLAMGPDGLLYGFDGNVVRTIDPATGHESAFSGQAGASDVADGNAATATFGPHGLLAFGRDGELMMLNSTGYGNVPWVLRRVAADGSVTTVAEPLGSTAFVGGFTAVGDGFAVFDASHSAVLLLDASGHLTPLAGGPGNTGLVDGRGSATRLSNPRSIAVDAAGNAYLSDQTNRNVIRKIAPDGTVSTYATVAYDGMTADTGNFWHLAVDPSGNVYSPSGLAGLYRIGTDGSSTSVLPAHGLSTHGGIPTGPDRDWEIWGLAARADGKLIACTQYAVYAIDPADPEAYVVLPAPVGCVSVASNAAGQVFELVENPGPFADPPPAGTTMTLYEITDPAHPRMMAGGPMGFADGAGSAAQFGAPLNDTRRDILAMAADESGDVFLIDPRNRAIRKVSADGVVTTVFGGPDSQMRLTTGSPGGLDMPVAIAVVPGTGGKRLLVVDQFENSVVELRLP
ncbi:MAG TPA: hypothetical protein VF457_01855 [Burkholderiaceae bacterium]